MKRSGNRHILIISFFSFLLVISCRQTKNISLSHHKDRNFSGNEFSTADPEETVRKKHNVWVFIMAGQSNMAGRGQIEPEDTVTHKRILTINSAGQLISAREPLHFYEPRRAGLDCGLSFGKALIQHIPDSVIVLLIPAAVGGSSIDQWLGDSLHRQVRLLSNFRDKVQLGLQEGEIKAILWHQGESDAQPALISSYKDKLSKLFSTFRNIAKNERLPVFIGEIGFFPKNRANRERINAVINEYVSQDKDARVISARGLQHTGDEVHFDSRGQRIIGQRFAQEYLDHINEKR